MTHCDRLTVVSYCTDPGCRCDHGAGVVEYDGTDPAAADAALAGRLYPRAVVEYETPHGHPAESRRGARYTHTGYRPHTGHSHRGRLYGHTLPRPGKVHALDLPPGADLSYRADLMTLCGEAVHYRRTDEAGDARPNVFACGDPAAPRVTCARCLKIIGV